MTIDCPECGENLEKETRPYKYSESGLDNVFIEGLPVYSCKCGVSFPSILRLPRLNQLIASALIRKPALLLGKEIKYIRKRMRLSSLAFSSALKIGKTTLSKWENDKQNHSPANDMLIRIMYLIHQGRRRTGSKPILAHLLRTTFAPPLMDYAIIAEMVDNDYNVAIRPLAGTQAIGRVLRRFTPRAPTSTMANPQWVLPSVVPRENTSYVSPQVHSDELSSENVRNGLFDRLSSNPENYAFGK